MRFIIEFLLPEEKTECLLLSMGSWKASVKLQSYWLDESEDRVTRAERVTGR